MSDFPEFEEVHAISDLHLGGLHGFQVFDLGQPLAQVIHYLAKRKTRNGGSLALILNGDLVDFLAEPNAKAFDPEGAIAKLERIAGDRSFAPVFESLRAFTKEPDRLLVITLGNHDLELALPQVKKKLLELLADSSHASARGRVRFAFDGTGFRCRVHGRNVLAIHGNDTDTWNLTDYERLRRIKQDLVFGLVPEPWKPNAGSRLVVEVMNEVKQEFPFIDLLKPELEAAVPILLALRPNLTKKLGEVVSVVARHGLDSGKRHFRLLAAEEGADGQALLSQLLGLGTSSLGAMAPEDLLAATEARLRKGDDPADLADLESDGELLSFGSDIKERWITFRRKMSLKATKYFFARYADAPEFELGYPDETFQALDAQVSGEIDFLLAGHTHLARDLTRRGGGRYLNTGTWIPLILPKKERYAKDPDGDAFERVWQDLQAERKELMANADLVQRQPRVAQVLINHDGKVEGRLVLLPAHSLDKSQGWSEKDLAAWLGTDSGKDHE